MQTIILASSSPRRKEILTSLNIPFNIIEPDIDESLFSKPTPEELTALLACEKLNAVCKKQKALGKNNWVLAADTAVAVDNKILGKPHNISEAKSYIKSLSGKTHKVCTSIALYNAVTGTTTVKTAVTFVTFTDMSDKEICEYTDTGEWQTAAGGYRIQETACRYISKIEGTQSCVMGLPIFELYDMLRTQNFFNY